MVLLLPLPLAGEVWLGQLNKDLRINNPHKGAANQDILLRFLCNNNHLNGQPGSEVSGGQVDTRKWQ